MRSALLILAFAAMSACGFRPVYTAGAVDETASITVSDIPGRMGHELRKALLAELTAGIPGVDGSAELYVELDERMRRLGFNPDQSAARTDLRARVKYWLVLDDRTIAGWIEGESSFNVPSSPYGDIAAQSAARERGARQLAERLVNDMRVRLAQPEDEG